MAATDAKLARKRFWTRGEPMVWMSASAVSAMGLCAAILLGVVLVNGVSAFWPAHLTKVTLDTDDVLMGEHVRSEETEEGTRLQFKVGNRDVYGLDFRWIPKDAIAQTTQPEDAIAIEREEYGNFYGFIEALPIQNPSMESSGTALERLIFALDVIAEYKKSIHKTEGLLSEVNREIRYAETAEIEKAYEKHGRRPATISTPEIEAMRKQFSEILQRLDREREKVSQHHVVMKTIDGKKVPIKLVEIVRVSNPNSMGLGAKLGYYAARMVELLTDEPRESNTEGGLFPAIFGTVLMVLLMAILSFPLGVLAGIYLREYAKDGFLVRFVRIAVNNLAGIPSIVYGIFGLGFFVYGIGSSIDQFFFPERLPEPVYGTGGILWASATLGILTIPVVIVATEEALGSIPNEVRQSSLALGATRFQTLLRVLMPIASPGIMTGFILAMARAVGEVAPLMITGVVKLAPSLPIDGEWPFLHFDRKFMHLGFHIFDISSQSPNVEAAKPMVYVTTLLLLAVVLSMSGIAIWLRGRMARKYTISATL